jgi:hypothetical protein
MSAPPPPQASRYLLPVLFGVTYLASVIADFGFISLFLGRDVIEEADAGTLLGPAMVFAACVVTAVGLVRASESRMPWAPAAGAAVSAYVVMLLVGGVGYAVGRGELIWTVLFAASHAGSPFVVSAAVLSAVFVVGLWALSRRPAGR